MGNMFQVYRDFEKEVNAVRSVDETRKLAGGSLADVRPVAREEQGRGQGGHGAGAAPAITNR